MKKSYTILAAVFMVFTLLTAMPIIFASAVSGSASLSGPGTVRAGDKITVILNLNGSGVNGFQGTVNYSGLTYTGGEKSLGGNWVVTFSAVGGKVEFSGYSTDGAAINHGALMRLSFTVGNVSEGTSLSVSVSGMRVTDAASGADCSVSPWSAKVSPPISGNANLSSLTVKNGMLNPAFNPNTLNYTMNVPFEVSKLDITAAAVDAKANISYSNPALTPNGTTNITVTVTAESGVKKTYTIKVSRARDPNYVESTNNSLASLTVEAGTLIPDFNADITSYSVSAPFEVEKLIVNATAADKLAKVDIGNTDLQAGATTDVVITVTAEDGSKKTYTVKAVRASYVPGANNLLSGIQLDKCMLSPAFQSDVTRYLVWLPFEADSLRATGVAADEKAKVEVIGGDNLEPGKDNEIKIICTSENGEAKEYIVIARRPDENGNIMGVNTQTSEGKSADGDASGWGLMWWLTLLLCIAAAALGFAVDRWVLKGGKQA